MKFPTDRPVKVVMLGAGGTGAYVAPHVYRLLHVLDPSHVHYLLFKASLSYSVRRKKICLISKRNRKKVCEQMRHLGVILPLPGTAGIR